MHFIADFLIRSIIRTRLFNDYLGSLANTLSNSTITRLFNDYNDTESYNPPKTHEPRRRIGLQRGSLYDGTAENPYFKRFSGVEKVHRNSIKITVDLWQRMRDSNPRKRSQSPVCYRYTNPLFDSERYYYSQSMEKVKTKF